MIRASSLRWPITLGIILQFLVLAVLIFWVVGQAVHGQWALMTVGTIFLLLIFVGVVWYLVLTIKEVRLTRRQANFIDSVTHELKSPIASIKLCLQTLETRDVAPEQTREFHKFMLDDVRRLDSLIDQLLQAARLEHKTQSDPPAAVPIRPLLQQCVDSVVAQYGLDPGQVTFDVSPCMVIGRPAELEIVFKNLLDNAAKYGGTPPHIHVQAFARTGRRVIIRVSDDGKGIRPDLRRKVFNRFVRGGTELERTTQGTGLGLHLVRSLVQRSRGRVQVHGRGPLKGATFEVELPGEALPAESSSSRGTAASEGADRSKAAARTPQG